MHSRLRSVIHSMPRSRIVPGVGGKGCGGRGDISLYMHNDSEPQKDVVFTLGRTAKAHNTTHEPATIS